MADTQKYDRILDALQQLMIDESIQNISVSDIAAKAGIGKGSIYYYFPSKEAILDALIRRNYEAPLQTAKLLADQTDIPPFTRMAMLFQACRSSAAAFLKQGSEKSRTITLQESAYLHQKYLNYLISELKPNLAKIIRQGICAGEIHFYFPEALAEISPRMVYSQSSDRPWRKAEQHVSLHHTRGLRIHHTGTNFPVRAGHRAFRRNFKLSELNRITNHRSAAMIQRMLRILPECFTRLHFSIE